MHLIFLVPTEVRYCKYLLKNCHEIFQCDADVVGRNTTESSEGTYGGYRRLWEQYGRGFRLLDSVWDSGHQTAGSSPVMLHEEDFWDVQSFRTGFFFPCKEIGVKRLFAMTAHYQSLARASDLCSHILLFLLVVSCVLSLVCFATSGETGKFFFFPGSSHLCSIFFLSHCWSSAHLLFQHLFF